jgi:gliding motility-associated-like protein
MVLLPQAIGGQASAYLWKPSLFLSCTTCAAPTATPAHTQQYLLWAQNEFFCTDTTYAIVRTHTQEGIYMPNAFTPNNDGKNDVFYVMADNQITEVKQFAIYNRWGQKVFGVQNVPANDPRFGWNGKAEGEEATTQVFAYYVTVKLKDGSEKTIKGTVTIIR